MVAQQVRDPSCSCCGSGYCCGGVLSLGQEFLCVTGAAKKEKNLIKRKEMEKDIMLTLIKRRLEQLY